MPGPPPVPQHLPSEPPAFAWGPAQATLTQLLPRDCFSLTVASVPASSIITIILLPLAACRSPRPPTSLGTCLVQEAVPLSCVLFCVNLVGCLFPAEGKLIT